MGHSASALTSLLIAFVAALIGGEIAQRIRVPAVVGQILAGLAIGPYALNWISVDGPFDLLSQLGAVLLLFSVGLETRLKDLLQVGKVALLTGMLGVIVPFVLAIGWAQTSGFSFSSSAFIAAAFVATSAGITAKVLQEFGVLERIESRVILGAAVIDDVLAMLLLAVVTSLQTKTGIDVFNLFKVLGGSLLFMTVVVLLGSHVMRKSPHLLDAPIDNESPITIAFAICLALAVGSSQFGLASIIGAFMAGLILAETPHRTELRHDFERVSVLLVPFFFVSTGAAVDISVLTDWKVLAAVLVVTLLATAGKLIGCGWGAFSLGKRSAIIIGVGMIPRGEVGVIIAGLGQQAGVFPKSIYAIIVGMSLLTSIIAPLVLKGLLTLKDSDTGLASEAAD